jgi:hypothetical protein
MLLDRFGFHLVVTPSPSPPLEQRAECFTSLTACPLWRPRLGGAFSPIVQFIDVLRQYTGNQPVQIFHCLFRWLVHANPPFLPTAAQSGGFMSN